MQILQRVKMVFIRIKNIKNKNENYYPYFYVVKSIWTKKGSRQKVIGYLGRVQYLRAITKKTIINLFSKSNNKCSICKKDNWLTIDHIIPLSQGGSNNPDNLQILCGECNQKKRDLLEKPLENIVTKNNYNA